MTKAVAVVAPRLAGDLAGRHLGKQTLDLGDRGAREALGQGEQHRGRGRAVLGLAQ